MHRLRPLEQEICGVGRRTIQAGRHLVRIPERVVVAAAAFNQAVLPGDRSVTGLLIRAVLFGIHLDTGQTRVGKFRGDSAELLDRSGVGDGADAACIVNDAQRVDGVEFGARNSPDAVVAEIFVEGVSNARHIATLDHGLGDVRPAHGPPSQFAHPLPRDLHSHGSQLVHVQARGHHPFLSEPQQRGSQPCVPVVYEVTE